MKVLSSFIPLCIIHLDINNRCPFSLPSPLYVLPVFHLVHICSCTRTHCVHTPAPLQSLDKKVNFFFFLLKCDRCECEGHFFFRAENICVDLRLVRSDWSAHFLVII